ncbi:hypothetical protein SEA_ONEIAGILLIAN_42 [Microbacterium phage OneinaGillian]|uniref:Uncharacterized protein n=1 Tax=Microbacterium phage OneinaGillian TaxID=2301604 RepID=A0A385UEA3_9CAUD|nr:hypothetical protein HOU23_gp042 [Microbacterium phage OneinaGillian]QJD53265.1 hypothetical protein SEA_TEMPO_42 [Microbacterium phage Tempo]QKO02794.1 hypothetical protein SEA_KELCOLE_41 [Microbacterium phage Kelcole]UOW92787.1 hypothetical protein SEA_ROBINROSE_44 [Microbacterium phage RobinRose]WNN94069.1 hypothetical protein SEA_FREGLEY_43 [Microbacterium phage Fregley]WNT44254.1 hypothetical protein SEA_CANDC_41 [Microbacterium phage CandC]
MESEEVEQRADQNLETSVSKARTGAMAVQRWNTVLHEFRGMYEENGFGRDLKKIMMMSTRES